LATHREVEDLLAIGAYKRGSIPRLDEALTRMPQLESFLQQRSSEQTSPDVTVRMLEEIWRNP
jgi:flagellum-specific ATP synthase